MDSGLAATASQWAADSNQALHIQLISADTPEAVLKVLSTDIAAAQDKADDGDGDDDEDSADVIQFHPAFTYPIYGEHERVFGYKGLRINLSYAAGSLATLLEVTYTKRIDDMESSMAVQLRADDVDKPLRELLGDTGVCTSHREFAERVARDTATFRPPGRKMHEYTRDDTTYEIYEGQLAEDSAVRELHGRLQLFVLLYIEGAQYIDAHDPRWRLFTVFEKLELPGGTSYQLVGFCTLYEFFAWPDRKRPRISQFLVLPPFQARGHGSELYAHIYRRTCASPECRELTVEDPSEAFDDMRDRNDLRTLLGAKAFDGLCAPVASAEIDALARRFKLSRRQLTRCLEIVLLRSLDKKNAAAYAAYRLFVKRRIYAQNSDQMAAMDAGERKIKVAEAYAAVEDDYYRILGLI
ncbi:histone acetyltransferase 1 [Coemansia sp. Benny D115]|nr:histone acetyltransferase 1 [Coemansia sp. Benny D115]